MPNGSTFQQTSKGPTKVMPLTVQGQTQEAKIPAAFWNPWNTEGTGDQAQRCMDCGSLGCQTGMTNPTDDIQIVGCPFERNIPLIHKNLIAAKEQLNAAYIKLKALDPEALDILLDGIQGDYNVTSYDLAETRAQFPKSVFAKLREKDRHAADTIEQSHDYFVREAFSHSYLAGPMGDIFGRICPARYTLCESGCLPEHSGFGAVEIASIEASLWDYAWESGWLPPIKAEEQRDETFVVIGSGFAAFAFAERMLEQGFKVVMVDKNDALGEPGNGQILNYKSHQKRFNRHYQRLIDSGMRVMTDTEVGMDEDAGQISPENLVRKIKDQFNLNVKGITFATGTPFPKEHRVKGEAKDDILHWGELTKWQAKADRENISYDQIPDRYNASGKRVAIIGTGDTAVDCVRTAAIQMMTQSIKEGAKHLTLISRHDRIAAEDKGAWDAMMREAKAKGVTIEIQEYMQPTEINKNPVGGYVLSGDNRRDGHKDEPISLNVDMVVSAIGNETGDMRKQFGLLNKHANENGSLKFDPVTVNDQYNIGTKAKVMGHGAGSLGEIFDGVKGYVIGDAARGKASLAAIAGRDGVDLARHIAHEEYGLTPAA